jgi:hypothetical protein
LLTADKRPLSDFQIGRLLRIPSKTMSKVLKQFLSVQLIEKIRLPDFDKMADEGPDDDAPSPAEERKKKSRAHAKRRRAQSSAQARSPLKNGKTANGKGKGKATVGLTASGSNTKNNGNGKDDPQGRASEQGESPSRTTESPPTTPEPLPSEPQESDEQGDRVTPTPSPLPSLSQGQSSHGLSYGRRVYLALGYHHDVDSIEARREITSFASKHDELVSALAGLSPPAVDALLARGLAEAVKIGKRKGNRNKGAIWHTVMGKLAAAAQQRSPPDKQCKAM